MENGKLFAAMAAAQAEFPPVKFDSSGQVGQGKYRYASLGAIWSAVRPVLAKHGLAVIQMPDKAAPGHVGLSTIIGHASGESITSSAEMPGGDTPQKNGSAYTYLRRYSLAAALGIVAEEDDDGAHASAPPSAKPATNPATPAASKQQRPSAPVWMITGFKALGVPADQFETARAYLRTVAPTAERGEALVADMLEDGMMWRPEIGTFGREDGV